MNKAKNGIVVTKEGDAWLMSPKFGDTMSIIGSSIELYVKNGVSVEFAMFKLSPQVRTGLIIVEDYKGKGSWETYFITIDASSERPFNLEEHIFVPKNGAVLNIINHRLEVAVGEKIFTSNPEDKTSGKQYVDASLLCQYAADLIPLQTILDIACDEVREVDALAEAAELRKEVKKLESNLHVAEEQRESLMRDLAKAKDTINTLLGEKEESEVKYKKLGKSRKEWMNLARDLFILRKKSLWERIRLTPEFRRLLERLEKEEVEQQPPTSLRGN